MPLTQVQGGMVGPTGFANLSGITFPATQVPSADANTLDDYEEGQWTPSVGGTATYQARTGQYIKIGRFVYLTFDMTINQIGTGTTATISNLPFAAGGVSQGQAGSVAYYASLSQGVVFLALRVDLGSTELAVAANTANQTTMSANLPVFGNSTRLIGSLFYCAQN